MDYMDWLEIVGRVLLIYVAVVLALGVISVVAVGVALALKHAALGLMWLVRRVIDPAGLERDRAAREAVPRLTLALAENLLLRQLADVAGVARERWLEDAIEECAPMIVVQLAPQLTGDATAAAVAVVVREIEAALNRAKDNLDNARRVVPC